MGRYFALVPMALALAACGGRGGGGTGSPPVVKFDPVASAAEKTSKQDTAKADFTISGDDMTGKGTAEFDDRSDASRVAADFERHGESIHMDGISIGYVLYLKSPVFYEDPSFPAAKDWAKIDVEAAAKAQGIDFDSLNPSSEVDFLRGSNGRPHKVGTERVRGVSTTHYEATIDLEAAAEKASGKAQKTIRKMIDLSGTKAIPIEAWIDKRGLVRKLTYAQHYGPDSPEFTIAMTLYDYGRPVSIEAPPARDVFDATKLATQ
jgi:hypothetical protein